VDELAAAELGDGALKVLGLDMRTRKALRKLLLRFGSGGWLAPGVAHPRGAGTLAAAVECGVARVEANKLDAPGVLAKFARRAAAAPLLVSGVGLAWPARAHWRRDELLARYGGARLRVGAPSDTSLFGATSRAGYADRTMTLREYVEGFAGRAAPRAESLFAFDRDEVLPNEPAMRADFEAPVFVEALIGSQGAPMGSKEWNMLSLGDAGEGIPLHDHGASWLATVYGYKDWWLYEPGSLDPADRLAADPFAPVASWAALAQVRERRLLGPDVRPASAFGSWISTGMHGPMIVHRSDLTPFSLAQRRPGLRCVTGPGDMLFVPAGWAHATLNLSPVIGVGGQITWDFGSRMRISQDALQKQDGDYFAHKAIGLSMRKWVLDRGGETELARALTHLGRAVELLPRDLFARKSLVEVLLHAGRLPEARAALAELVALADALRGEAADGSIARLYVELAELYSSTPLADQARFRRGRQGHFQIFARQPL
jgi:hypothetical protein